MKITKDYIGNHKTQNLDVTHYIANHKNSNPDVEKAETDRKITKNYIGNHKTPNPDVAPYIANRKNANPDVKMQEMTKGRTEVLPFVCTSLSINQSYKLFEMSSVPFDTHNLA